MILAAGYGVRLRPLTDRMPKPLAPVAGQPMIGWALARLAAYGIKEVVVNVSHHKDQLVAWLRANSGFEFRISEEAEPLETGGGLKKAAPLLGNEPFFVVNSDIIWQDEGEPALERLARHWDGAAMDFLLLAQSKTAAVGHDKGEDQLFVTEANTIGWSEAQAPYIIAGIGIMHPRVLAGAPDGKFSVKGLWLEAMKRKRLFCVPHQGRWFQTGTIEDIRKAEALLAGVGGQGERAG
ncbi:MAG: nucleotidyltransferase family protein [Verrucomicrobia bacterium]|nr:nucleotidyltransferase family protein [Verrucomicrobiota bacterium]